MRALNAGTSGLIPKRNGIKFLTFHLPFSFCLLIRKLLKLNGHPEYCGIYYSWWNHQMRFKMVHFNIEKSGVSEFQVYNLRTTHTSVLYKLKIDSDDCKIMIPIGNTIGAVKTLRVRLLYTIPYRSVINWYRLPGSVA